MLHLLLALAASTAAPAPPPPDPTTGPAIVVEGRRLSQHEVSEAVRAIGRPDDAGGFEFQFARWDGPLCVAVAGLPREGGEYLADHLGAIARDLGIGSKGPGCKPNAFIIVTADPAALIQRARFSKPGLVSGLYPALLDRIVRSDDAVRAIASTDLTSGDGDAGTPSTYGESGHDVVTLPQWNASKLNAPTQTHLSRVTVIVDSRQLDGISYAQLSAYLAMVTFARLDVHSSKPDVDTILTLFPRGQAAPQDLTAFDQAYLRALYTVAPNMPGDQQRLAMIGMIQKLIDGLEKDKRLRAPIGLAAHERAGDAQPSR